MSEPRRDHMNTTGQKALIRNLCMTGEARAIRLASHLSLADVAADVGVSPSTVHRWETGSRLPKGDLAVRYAEVLEGLTNV